MKQEEWTSKLRNQMADFEEAVPEGLWEQIEQALPVEELAGKEIGGREKTDVAGSQSGKARTVPMWRRVAAAAVAALLLSGGAYIYHERSADRHLVSQQTMVQPAEENGTAGTTVSDRETDLLPEPADAPLLAQTPAARLSRAVKSAIEGEQVASDGLSLQGLSLKEEELPREITAHEARVEPMANAASDDTDARRDQTESKTDAMRNETARHAGVAAVRRYDAGHSASGKMVMAKEEKAQRFTMSLYAQNVAGGGGEQASPVMMNTPMNGYSMTEFATTSSMASSLAKKSAPIYLSDYEEKSHHKQPVAFGLSLAWQLSDRMALQTGVNYTRLSSQFTKKMRSSVLVTDQQLQYLGVPVRVSYLVWRMKSLSVYGVAGGEADVNVKAKTNTDGIESRLTKDRLQFSADAAAGIQYHFLPKLSLYAEPGLKYYFDNGSTIENIYKEKPLQFSLQMGVRYDLK